MIEFLNLGETSRELIKQHKKIKRRVKLNKWRLEHCKKKLLSYATLSDLDKYSKVYQKMMDLKSAIQSDKEELLKIQRCSVFVVILCDMITEYSEKDIRFKVIIINEENDKACVRLQLVDDNYSVMNLGIEYYSYSDSNTCTELCCCGWNGNPDLYTSEHFWFPPSKYYTYKELAEELERIMNNYKQFIEEMEKCKGKKEKEGSEEIKNPLKVF